MFFCSNFFVKNGGPRSPAFKHLLVFFAKGTNLVSLYFEHTYICNFFQALGKKISTATEID